MILCFCVALRWKIMDGVNLAVEVAGLENEMVTPTGLSRLAEGDLQRKCSSPHRRATIRPVER